MTTTVSDIEERIKQLKIEGNTHFKSKNYVAAIKYYSEAIDDPIYGSDIHDIAPLIELRQVLLLNRAKSYFKTNHLKEALIDSSNCINTCEGTKYMFKAHFTRAEIYNSVKDYKNAIKHCDTIINETNPTLNISELKNRTKKLKKQIREKTMRTSAKKSKKSRRANKVLLAMTMTMGQQRQQIETAQRNDMNSKKNNTSSSGDIALVISSKWWNKWYQINPNTKLSDGEIDMNILVVDNSDLIDMNKLHASQATEEKKQNQNENENKSNQNENKSNESDIIEIKCVYLDHNLRDNLLPGVSNDYILLNFHAFQDLTQMGYKLQPAIWVKKCDHYNVSTNRMEKKRIELYKTRFTVLFNQRTVFLLCSRNETIRKITTEIARHFVIQSSSIRLRYKDAHGEILDRSHTLGQHGVRSKIIYIELRLPNGCWPINNNLDKYEKKNENKENQNQNQNNNADKHDGVIICNACQRIISHYVDCSMCVSMNNNNGKNQRIARYCNARHLSSDFKYHKLEHETSFGRMRRFGLCGLDNLGNTCYMNSSLQCLSHIAELRSYLICNDFIDDINKQNPLGHGGVLAQTFAEFLKQMWFGLYAVVKPMKMRKTIATLHSQWIDTQQQDAQEFLGWLIDGLHEDLNLILKKPYRELPDSGGRDDEIVANEHWKLHLERNQSIIVDLFQGQYKSTLQCPSCDQISVKFDPFSSLTLPIPDKDTMIAVQCLVFSDGQKYPYPFKLTVNVSGKAVVTQLINVLKEKLQTHLDGEQLLLVCRVSHNKFGKYWSCGRPIKKVVNSQHYTYIYQTKSTTIAKRKQDDLVQVRMNFCYKLQQNPNSDSSLSGDSDEIILMNSSNNQNNQNQKATDTRIFFAHPIVFDVLLTEFSGNNMYEIFKQRFKHMRKKKKKKNKNKIEEKENDEISDWPLIHMYLRKEGVDMEINTTNDKLITDYIGLTNSSRNVATINIEFTEYEYKSYINPKLTVRDLDFETLSDAKPKNGVDIYDCLKLYTAAEVLDDIVWKCPKCLRKGQPSKQLHLWRLPEILIIHLKRFVNEQGYFGGVGRKISLMIKTPINGLDLKKYLAQTLSNSTNLNIPKYDLFATLNHNGMMNFGHYYACVKTDLSTQITNFYEHYADIDPTWNLFNDDKMHKISVDDLHGYTKDAYLLFYRRRNNV